MTEEKKERAVTIKPDAPLEYGRREEIKALADRFAVMLPNAKDLSPEEILMAAQYCRMMDVNPFRGEVYFVKSRGKILVVDGYKVLARWAQNKASYTMRDVDLPCADGQLEHVRVWILRDDRKAMLREFVDMGATFKEAYEMAAHYADGVVTVGDTKGKEGPKDPPVGWTWRDVARKRAFKNAVNLSHGAPSPREIAKLSWVVNGQETAEEDWAGAEELSQLEAEKLAELRARTRNTVEAFKALTPAEQEAKAAANSQVLYGEAGFEGFEDSPSAPTWTEPLFTAGEEQPASKPEPDPAPEQPKNGKGWTAGESRDAMEKLLILANEATVNHYKGTQHLFATMKKERGADFAWGNPHDADLWAGYLSTLINHVQKDAGQKELPL